MKINKIMIVGLLLLAIMTLGAVSATEELTASETQDSLESSVDDADVIADEDDIGGEDENPVETDEQDDYDEKEYLYQVSQRLNDEYLVGDTNSFGIGIEQEVSGNVTISIDNETVYNRPVSLFVYDEHNRGGNFIKLGNYNLDYGEHSYVVTYTGDDRYYSRTWEGTFNYHYMMVNVPDELVVGAYNDHFTIQLSKNATGNIIVLIDNREFYSKSVEEARESEYDEIYIYMDNITFDHHEYKVIYSGGNYDETNQSGEFDLSYYFNVECWDDHIPIGDKVRIYVYLPGDISSDPKAVVNNKTYYFDVDVDMGECMLTLTDFTLGENVIEVSYSDDKYPFKSENITVYVHEVFNIPPYVDYKSEDAIELVLPRDANGNLVVNISGEVKKVKLVNGSAKFLFNDYTVGDYEIVAGYDGDDYEVEDRGGPLYITPAVDMPNRMWINGTYEITIISPDDSLSNVTVSIYETNYDPEWWYDDSENFEALLTIYNGSARGTLKIPFNLKGLDADRYYKITADFDGNYAHSQYVKVKSQSPFWDYSFSLPQKRMKYAYEGEDDYSISGPSDADGVFTLYFDDVESSSTTLYEGWGDLYLGYWKLDFGEHTWKLTYTDDSYYKDFTKEGKINITWYGVYPSVDDISVYVRLDDDATGVATLYIDDEENATQFLSYGSTEFTIAGLTSGEHTYEIIVVGNETFSDKGTFNITTYMDINNFYYYSNITEIEVYLPSCATGTVEININNKTYSSKVTGYTTIIEVPGLVSGEYPSVVSYSGDGRYDAISKEFNITVSYGIVEEYDFEGNRIACSLLLPKDAKGSLIVKITNMSNHNLFDKIEVPLVDGYARYEFTELPCGDYYYRFTYDQDDYEVDSDSERRSFGHIVDITEYIPILSEGYVYVELAGATGNIIVTLDGEELANESISSGKINVTIPNTLKFGNHVVILKYEGEGDYQKYFEEYDDETDEYVPLKYLIRIAPSTNFLHMYYQREVILELPDDAKGYIEIYSWNDLIKNETVSGNKVNISLADLHPGFHRISISYIDEKYGNYSWTAWDWEIFIPLNPKLEIETPASEIPTIIVKLDKNATGTVFISINKEKYVKTLKDGQATFEIPDLEYDNYEVQIGYSGDGNYSETSWSETVAVGITSRLNPDLAINFTNIQVGEDAKIYISMNKTINGIVSLKVGNVPYNVTIANGQGNRAISGLNAGEYKVTAKFDGNTEFKGSEKIKTLTVSKLQAPEILITTGEAIWGTDLAVNVTVAGATGSVTINGKKVDLTNGQASAGISDLSVGEFKIVVAYSGDETYLNSSNTKTITVNPAESDLTLSNDTLSFDYGQSGSLAVTYTGATNITSTVLDEGKKVVEGVVTVKDGVITVSSLDAGVYTLVVKTVPDENHKEVIKKADITVKKIDSTLTVSSETAKFNYGASTTVTVSYEGASDVFVAFDDVAGSADQNGKVFTISNMPVGSNNVTFITVPDKNHNSVSKNVLVTVSPVQSTLNLSSSTLSFNYGASDSLTATYTGATGVSASVLDKDKKAVEGVATVKDGVITVSGLDAGAYTLVVKTLPDANHTAVSKEANVTVAPVNVGLTVKVTDIEVGNNAVVNVEINKDATGRVLIDGNAITIADGKAKYTINTPAIGNHTVAVKFEGDVNFLADEKSANYEVIKKSTSADKITAGTTADGKNPTFSIALDNGAKGSLKVEIAGKTFTEELSGGKATITVSGVAAGTYVAVVTYSGDDVYASAAKTFNAVVKVDPKITAKDLTMQYSAGSKFSVTVYGDNGKVKSGEYVVFKVNGKQVAKVKTNQNGVATYKPIQTPGTYKISATALKTTVTKKLVVKQVLTLKTATFKKSKGVTLTATLAKVNGKYLNPEKITFKFNGKTVKPVKTYKNGVAKVTISKKVLKNFKVGKKVTYQATYLKVTVKKTAKIKK